MTRSRLIALAALLCISAMDASAQRHRAVTAPPRGWVKFDVGDNQLSGIAADPDGSVWFAGDVTGRVTSGVVSFFDASLGRVSPLLLTSDKRLCGVSNQVKPASMRCINANGSLSEFNVGDATISGLTETADGTLWLLQQDRNRLVGIQRDGQETTYDLPQSLGHPSGLTIGPDGTLFFVSDRTLVSVLPGGVIHEQSFDDLFAGRASSRFSTNVAVTADGARWLGIASDPRTRAYEHHGEIVRVAPDGSIARFDVGGGHFPSLLRASTTDASLWFLERYEISYLSFYDLVHVLPNGKLERFALPVVSYTSLARYAPTGLTIDILGHPWVSLNADPTFGEGSSVVAVLAD